MFTFSNLKTLYTENVTNEVLKNAGITLSILFVVIVSQLLLHSVVQIVDSIPVFNSLLEVIGLYAFGRFAFSNLVTQEQRQELVEKVQYYYQEMVG